MVTADDLAGELLDRINAHFEWLLVRPNGRTFPLRNTEIEIQSQPGKIVFGVVDDKGFGRARVLGFAADDEGIAIDISRRFDSVNETIRLVPRTPARELTRNIDLARIERANQIARALTEAFPALKILRIALSRDNGRLGQIFVREVSGREHAVLADVTGSMTHEALMTSAMIWAESLWSRKKPVSEVWIAAEKRQARALRKLAALFSEKAAKGFRVFEITNDAEKPKLKELKRPPLSVLWREKSRKLVLPPKLVRSDTAARIIALAPDKIDVIISKHGETIRFMGLPFARVRTLAGQEKAWFGVERDRRLLHDGAWNDLIDLIGELDAYRRAESSNKRHEFYRSAPEAWLESILRRNIRALDANLILSPIYNQFRAAADKIDLLAIRRDGRLVIVELKTAPDREMVFQAADYWRKIELQRRRGELARIRAFDDMEILDQPALIYAVAPALAFHRDFGSFARALKREVEMWRFELHEDWRSEIKVLTRREYKPEW